MPKTVEKYHNSGKESRFKTQQTVEKYQNRRKILKLVANRLKP
jgi:hypothetical protein